MILIEQKEAYIYVSSNDASFGDFLMNFEEEHAVIAEKHIIISISESFKATEKDILSFLNYAEIHQKNGTTFVVVCTNVEVDSFPEAFNIVPTLQEAEDVLEMENIQRDLGF